MRFLLGLVCFPALLSLQAPPRRPLVEQALDQIVQFETAESALTEACAALGRQAGVEIIITPEALNALPYGGDTKVTATLRNITLREGLDRLLAPLCMRHEVAEEGVRVLAHPALLRIGRRAAWTELDVLRSLHEARWHSAKDAEAWQARMQFRVPSAAPWTELAAAIDRAGTGQGDQVLTLACESRGWTWYPQAVDRVVILTASDQVARLLRARVSLRCAHRPLTDVLTELAQKAGVSIRAEPGATASLPRQTRENFSLLAERITITEALDQIAAATGLGYRIEDTGVVFSHPGAMGPHLDLPAAVAKSQASDPYVAKLVLPPQSGGLQLEILIRQSELSPEANEARKRLIKDADEIFVLELNRRAAND